MGGSAEKGVRGGQEHRREHETRAWRLGLPEGIHCPVRRQRRGTELELLSPHHVILATPSCLLASLPAQSHPATQRAWRKDGDEIRRDQER